MTDGRLARESVEAAVVTPGDGRLARESVEAAVVTPGAARLGRVSVELLTPHVGDLFRWDGSDWTPVTQITYWDGAAWTAKPLKRWSGTGWVEVVGT